MADVPPEMTRDADDLWSTSTAKGPIRSTTRLLAAALRFDSWIGAPLAFGMRGLPADTRHLLFSAMGRDIDLRISPADPHFALAGQILGPDESGRVELTPQAEHGEGFRTAIIDALGEFRLESVHSGIYRLTLHLGHDEIVLPPIEVGGRRA